VFNGEAGPRARQEPAARARAQVARWRVGRGRRARVVLPRCALPPAPVGLTGSGARAACGSRSSLTRRARARLLHLRSASCAPSLRTCSRRLPRALRGRPSSCLHADLRRQVPARWVCSRISCRPAPDAHSLPHTLQANPCRRTRPVSTCGGFLTTPWGMLRANWTRFLVLRRRCPDAGHCTWALTRISTPHRRTHTHQSAPERSFTLVFWSWGFRLLGSGHIHSRSTRTGAEATRRGYKLDHGAHESTEHLLLPLPCWRLALFAGFLSRSVF